VVRPPTRAQSTAAREDHPPPDPAAADDAPPPPTPRSSHTGSAPFAFATGIALHAKRPHSRPFPPPFSSRPSGSFSDPLSTHDGRLDALLLDASLAGGGAAPVLERRMRGRTNGDDAVVAGPRFVGAADGVGAWASRENGQAALWARLMAHFWAAEAERRAYGDREADADAEGDGGGLSREPNPVAYLQRAYEATQRATAAAGTAWLGTTTASGALLSWDRARPGRPLLYVAQLGDSQVMVLRPRHGELVYKTKEQWHWFDCPRQLGTNSPDTPEKDAVLDRVEIEVGDVVLAMSDGVSDNLWDHEIVQNVVDSLHRWDNGEVEDMPRAEGMEPSYSREMTYVAQELVKAARTIAEDPFAESPYMEKAIDEGLSIEGGEWRLGS
jgi:serine/threonine protein phosphatase PrpC